MLINILGSLFFLSILVCIISIVLVITNFFKRKKIGKLKYILMFSLAIMVISFLGFGLNYNPTPEQQARIEQRKQEKEEQKLERQEEKEQKKQEREKRKLEEQKEREQNKQEKEEQKLEEQKAGEQEKEEKLVEQQEKEQIQKDEEAVEENITKINEEIKVTNENDKELNETKTSEIIQEQDTQEQKIITATKKVFGEENYINVFYEPEDNFVLIKAKGKDLLSSSMTAKGMLKSIKDTLYEIREIPDLNVDFNIVYTMVNSAGDTSDDIVIKATYKNETRNSINWNEYVLHEDMPKIADEWWVHPAIQAALKE